MDPRPSRALTAVCQRRDGRPAAFRPAAQRRMAGRAILLLREEWAKPRGRRSRASHCGGQAGERSDRIVARDPPVKGPPGRVATSSSSRRAPAQTPHAAMRRHRTTSALRDAATHRPATRANEKRRPRPYWRQRRSAVGSDRGNITLVARQPRSDRRRRRIHQRGDQRIGCLEPPAPQLRGKHGFDRF
jgi:hypothetical protein